MSVLSFILSDFPSIGPDSTDDHGYDKKSENSFVFFGKSVNQMGFTSFSGFDCFICTNL